MHYVILTVFVLASHLAISASHVKATAYPYPSPPPPPYLYLSPPPLPYAYHSPPASPPFLSKPPPIPPPPPFAAVVTGRVYCDVCKNGHLKKPLKGVTVGVFCWNGKSEDSFYGTTDDKGAFKIELKGFDYNGCGGAKACAAKLIAASYTTPCTVPTNRHGGQKSARLHVKAKSEHGVTLKAGPFAYIPTVNYAKCYHHAKSPSGPYHYTSPPPPPAPCPPPPTYKYQSPPPPPY